MPTTKFVDFSAGVDGTGASTASPWNTIIGKTISAGDLIWIRRSGTALAIASSYTFNQGAIIRGWPKAGDPIASPLPGNPWDSDSADYAEMTASVSTRQIIVTTIDSMFRMKFSNTAAANTNTFISWTATPINEILYCYFTSIQKTVEMTTTCWGNIRHTTFETTSTGAPALKIPTGSTGVQCPSYLFTNCTFKNSSSATSGAYAIDLEYGYLTQVGFYNCSFIGLGDSTLAYIAPAVADRQTKTVFMDCSFDDSGRSGTSNGPMLLAHGSSYGRNISVNTKSGVVIGYTNQRQSWWSFSSFTQTASYTPALDIRGGQTVVRVSNFSPNGGSSPPIACQQCSRLHLINGTVGTLRKQNIWIKDDGALDAWTHRSLDGDVIKSAVTRTGGALYSAKMTYDQDSHSKRPLVFSEHGRETVFVYIPAGSRTITCYFAFKGFSAPFNGSNFWFEVESYDVINTAHRKITSSRGFVWLTDSSTWTGDSGLTTKAVSFAVNNQRAGLFPVRFFLAKYSATGLLYVDPRCQVV